MADGRNVVLLRIGQSFSYTRIKMKDVIKTLIEETFHSEVVGFVTIILGLALGISLVIGVGGYVSYVHDRQIIRAIKDNPNRSPLEIQCALSSELQKTKVCISN